MQNQGVGDSSGPLTNEEYDRIYQVIYGVLEDRANLPHACMFFAIAGSVLLNKVHKIAARPVAGAMLLCTEAPAGEPPKVLCIGKQDQGKISFDENNFHMWVQTEHHIVDFHSPLFGDGVKGPFTVPRKRFQKARESEAAALDLSQVGDWFTLPDPDLSTHFTDRFMERPSSVDLLLAVDTWYKPFPAPLARMALLDNYGKAEPLRLAAPAAIGNW